MTRVDWNRYPDDVEPVIGIMLCREFPNAQRIRPSRGDRGIDVLVPVEGGVEVYQVKSFATNLGSSQKAQIVESFERLKRAHEAKQVKVVSWHLTLPLNPTNENLEWLGSITEPGSFPCDWRGQDFIEGLAAKYLEVIEYYLGDGRDRLDRSMQDLLAILRGRSVSSDEPLHPGDVTDDLRRIHAALNEHDPHFRYSFRVDEHQPEITDEPMLVTAQQVSDETSTVTIYVFARYNEAVQDRPIPLAVRFDAPPGSQLAEDLRAFYKFGVPFQAPMGSSTIEADMPGGLGGTWAGGSVIFGPARTGEASPYVLRMQVVDGAGEEQALVQLNMEPVSQGPSGRGIRAFGQEASGVFTIEIRTDLDEQKVNISITPLPIAGTAPAEIVPGLRFLHSCHHPNRFRVALPRGPISTESVQIPEQFAVDTWEVRGALTLAESLATIQDHTAEQLVIPTGTVSVEEMRELARAARLLRGETVTIHWNQWQLGVAEEFAAGMAAADAFAIAHDGPLSVTLNGKTIELGGQRMHFLTARVDPDEPSMIVEPGMVRVTLVPGTSDEASATWLPDYVPPSLPVSD